MATRWSPSAGSTEADAFLAPHEELAEQRGRRSAIARLARARGRIEAAAGRPDNAQQAFARSLAAIENLGMPFEQARIELAAGSFLRRVGQRRRAADLLGAAHRHFGDLGAVPYLERCAHRVGGVRVGADQTQRP